MASWWYSNPMDKLTACAPPSLSSPGSGSAGAGGKTTLRKTAQEFEALFFQQMLRTMRSTVPDGGLIPRDNATRIYEEMLDAERARIMARRQSLGLAEAMERQVERQRSGR